ncbi:uncharacterized protein N0V89_012053 [Didymosphaeria variabile]|uniref:Something about silencing protein 4 domain-containing protein n=1 Tax=Didymosphaeria variabile TaxID=1932322 RepID=A0A9W9C5X0_9PLEO|nr:uncharacterized protein N0V89_012053 [Didymosphaeria variabile]KAJ4345917.1 hypothetical protein N0V89_012053 [Didymosphaeria variabile]
MLKAINTMANLIRPASDRRTTRHTRSRSPPPAEVAKQAAIHQQPPAPILTRRMSKTLPLPADAPSARDTYPTKQTSPARSRKRSIAEVDTPDARPPSKTKQRRSYDDLSTWANDATKKLHGHVEDVPSGASTPMQDTSSAMGDKKSLRSKNPVRKASELADIFEDYDQIIANWEDGESTENSACVAWKQGNKLTATGVSSIGRDDKISVVDEPLTGAQLEEFRENQRKKAAKARAQIPPPNPSHTYTKRPPFDYTPYASALPSTEDPLADTIYTKVHNRHEGVERKSRNRERDNLQYKMSKASPVLEELEGEDWHKVFVIDKSERDSWLPKRRYFIAELRNAIKKQDALRDVELKKRRQEKEKRRREKESPSSSSEDDDERTCPPPPFPSPPIQMNIER